MINQVSALSMSLRIRTLVLPSWYGSFGISVHEALFTREIDPRHIENVLEVDLSYAIIA